MASDSSFEARRVFAVLCAAGGAARSEILIEAESFEAAALAFSERWFGLEGECRVIVVDRATGERLCFAIAMDQDLMNEAPPLRV
ncbi:MAG: DUF5961 family protein [Caulobacteraceae bacterium]